MKSILSVFCFGALAALSLLSACNDDPAPVGPSDEINLHDHGSLGTVLVDGDGVTLYYFARDVKGESQCSGGCLDRWPPFHAETPEPGAGLDATDFATLTRSDGTKQTTYKGWPLYYYSPAADGHAEAPGEAGGEGFNSVWFVAKPDYSIRLAAEQLVGADGKQYTGNYTEGAGVTSYLADDHGRTLYLYTNDYKDRNTFTASDLGNNGVWPIFHDDLESIVSTYGATDFGTITVHGQEQLTYKGWPLYYFGQDAMRGDNKGVSVPSPGVWRVVNSSTTEAPETPTVAITTDDVYGDILTDGDGHTLYFFLRDADGTNHCTGGCVTKWPVFYSETIILEEGSVLDIDDFDEITLSDGVTKQTTYRGWPLYYFSTAGDGVGEASGEVGGDAFNTVWYVAKQSYGLMLANAQLTGHDGANYIYNGALLEAGTGLTRYFTDAYGRTVYTFKNDTENDNNFTASDFSNDGVWPIFHVEIDQLPSGMDKNLFGEIEVFGRKQLTFKGWPLYYFGQDAARGQTNGVSFPSINIWPIGRNELPDAP